MHPDFAQLTPQWFKRAFVYTGSLGDFRYRYANDKDAGCIHVAVYSVFCYEAATDKLEQDFPWDDEGIARLRDWMQQRYESYCKTGVIG